MSDFGEGIINRLADNCSLKDMNNPASKVIDKTVGAWLDEYYNSDFFSNVFLSEAEGAYLDVIGTDYSVYRQIGESDTDYRERIVYERLGHLTTRYLIDVYGLTLFKNVANFNPHDNTLTSDNEYLHEGFMCIADEQTKNILSKKFALGSGLTWL
jgi:hypothetical protein